MKLKLNDVILVHGFVMLKGLQDGQKYRVQSIPNHYRNPTYQFTKAKGKKVVCRHYAHDVDAWIKEKIEQINWIERNDPSQLPRIG